uniref:Signal recognition particle 14 kDa protein n=1 Tax=Lynx canadensis TaxID=61383 RepID=A0A667G3Z3_LYNCA
MVLLESEQFLTELTRLFQKCRLSGSVFITLKKYDGRTKPIPRKGSVEGFEPSDNKCLLRATDGKKKISTVVSSKEVNKFQMIKSNSYDVGGSTGCGSGTTFIWPKHKYFRVPSTYLWEVSNHR